MLRKITGFHQDDENHWVAELDCYHCQHVRHQPPFTNRPWVTNESGRKGKLGYELNCVLCDALSFPEGVFHDGDYCDSLEAYKRTPDFTDATVPQGLLNDHSTKTGSWGLIQVNDGALCYRITDPRVVAVANNKVASGFERNVETGFWERVLTAQKCEIAGGGDAPGVVVPNMLHCVEPLGYVSFYVQFYRASKMIKVACDD